MKKFLLIGGFGLLPLWVAVFIVIIGSYQSNNPNYWAVAPWQIVASVPLCVITLIIAFTTQALSGRVAFMSFVGLVALFVISAGVFRLEGNKRQQTMKNEEQHALEFVRNNSEVLEAAGSNEQVDLIGKSMSHGLPSRYIISVGNRARTRIAVVGVSRSEGNTTFTLACITTYKAAWQDRCEPAAAEARE